MKYLGVMEAVVSVLMLVPGAVLCFTNWGVFGGYYWIGLLLLFTGLYSAIDGANRLGLIAAMFGGSDSEQGKDQPR